MPALRLKNQRVVVIGGSSGIGFGVAKAALADGAALVIGGSDRGRAEAAAERLGSGATGGVADVRDEASLAAFFGGLERVDHLVYTAGDWGWQLSPGPLAEFDFAAAKDAMGVRFWGALAAVKHALAKLSPSGSITLTDGLAAHRPQKGAPLTSAVVGAVEHLARGLAVDLAPIRVNAVCPGIVMTERWASRPADTVRKMTERQLIPRGGDPAEVAEAYLYLMRGGYTTGQVLIVDGGRMLT